MNAKIFAEWLKRQGYQVEQTSSSFWYNQNFRVYQAFPYHWIIQPSENELQNFIKTKKAIALRYSTQVNAPEGYISYHAIYDKPIYNLENVGRWTRKNIRRGLSKCVVEPISFSRLAEEGYLLQLDTLDRQGRNVKIGHEAWRVKCLAANDLPGFEAWGALVGNKLAASLITFQMDDWCYMLYQQCDRKFLSNHVNNAMSYIVTKNMSDRSHINGILYGLHSLDAPPSVDEFKFRMGYTAKPVKQRVVFHPLVKPFINSFIYATTNKIHQLFPQNPLISKTEGMMRFYLDGLLPNDKQPIPLKLEYYNQKD